MPLRIEDYCPKCEEWLGEAEDKLSRKEYYSSAGFNCPHCNAHLVAKSLHKWFIPITILLWPLIKLLDFGCSKYEVACMPGQSHFESLASILLISFMVLICTQNLKLKDT